MFDFLIIFLENKIANKNYNRLKRNLRKKIKLTLSCICENNIFIILFFFLLIIETLLYLFKKYKNLFDLKFKLFLLFVKL